MQGPSGICGRAVTISFATWHRRFGSAINRLRSAMFGVSLELQAWTCCMYVCLVITYSKRTINQVNFKFANLTEQEK